LSTLPGRPAGIEAVQAALAAQGYVADRRLSTVIFLGLSLPRPVFLEGEPGVGKTELAKALAAVLGTELIRIQCHDGLDTGHVAYEWNVARQMMEIRLAEAAHDLDRELVLQRLYSREMLIERPLLRALTRPRPPVLLIDELDRADEPFDAYLLEALAENQITIPELGTVRAEAPPVVLITSNRTREVHDALRRRCLYHWVDYPDAERELAIVQARLPSVDAALAQQAVAFVQQLRGLDLMKPPGVAETLDWLRSLQALGTDRLASDSVRQTAGVLLKGQPDLADLAARPDAQLDGWLVPAEPAGAAP